MSTAESRAFIQRYQEAISGKEKPPALVNQYVANEALRQQELDDNGSGGCYVTPQRFI